MNSPEKLDKYEIEFLKAMCKPEISIMEMTPENGNLQLELTLKANQITYVSMRAVH